MNKEERERHLDQAMETNRGTFKPVIEEQYKIWLENHPDSKEGKKDLSKMSRKHRLRIMKKGQLRQIK